MSSIREHDSWVRLLQNNDNESFIALYHRYHQAVFANINRLVNRSPAAEDILQEVFLALWENRHKLNPDHTVAGWLFTASFYKASAYLKKSLRENLSPLYDSLEETPDEESEYETGYQEKLTAIHTAIALLPPRKKMAFRLCRLEGKSYAEAAEELGLSIESVKDYVKAASRFIRQHVVTHHPALICLYAFEISLYFHG